MLYRLTKKLLQELTIASKLSEVLLRVVGGVGLLGLLGLILLPVLRSSRCRRESYRKGIKAALIALLLRYGTPPLLMVI